MNEYFFYTIIKDGKYYASNGNWVNEIKDAKKFEFRIDAYGCARHFGFVGFEIKEIITENEGDL